MQSTCPPVDGTLNELLLLADACRLAGALRVTAVVPYFGHARQDRRVHGREPLGAQLVARCLAVAGVERLITIDLHSAALESAFPFPVEHLTAVPLLPKRNAGSSGKTGLAPPRLEPRMHHRVDGGEPWICPG